MNPGQINFHATEPRIQLYFLLGLVYAPVTPVLLPFIIIFFALAYLLFRHQVFKDDHYEDGRSEISGYCFENTDDECVTVPTKRQSRRTTPAVSHASRGSSSSPSKG